MEYCYEHEANKEHFRNLDKRVGKVEEAVSDQRDLIVETRTLVKTIQKLMWLIVAAMVTVIANGILPH